MIRTIWLGLIVTSIAARAGQLPAGVQFLPGPVNGPSVGGEVLVYGDAKGGCLVGSIEEVSSPSLHQA